MVVACEGKPKQNGASVQKEHFYNRDIEAAFVGMKLLGTELTADFIGPEDFFYQDLADLNSYLDEFDRIGGPIHKQDLVPFSEFLKERGEWDRLKLVLTEAAKFGQVTSNFLYYARRMRELRIRREVEVGLDNAIKRPDPEEQKQAIEAVFARVDSLRVSCDEWRFKPKTPWDLSTAEHETDFLVQVLREDDPRASVDGLLERVVAHLLRRLVVGDVALRVCG